MARTKYRKKTKNGNTYYFYRLKHKNLRIPRDLYGKTVKELEEKIEALTYQLDRNVRSSKVRFGDYMKGWLDTVHGINKKAGTVQGYGSIFDNYIKGSSLYNIQLTDLTALDVQDYLNGLLRKGKSFNVVSSVKKLIGPCIRYAYTQQKIIVDFSRSIKIQKPSERDDGTNVTPMTKEEQEKFVQAIKGATYEPLFLMALNTGARVGELLALTWDDVNFENFEIKITKTLEYQKDKETKKYIHIINSPKTKAGNRTIPFPEFMAPYLKNLRTKELKKKMRLQNKYADRNLVFANRLGDFLNSSSVRVSLDTILVDAGLPHFRFHDLRHTFATRLFELGESPRTIQTILGHTDVATTLNIYTHVLKDQTIKSAYKLHKLNDEFQLKNL